MGFTDILGDILDPGDVFGSKQDSRIKRANEAAEKAYNNAQAMSDANRSLFNDYFARAQETYGNLASKVGDKIGALEGMEAYDPGQFSYTGDVNDFYSKAANQRINDAMGLIREQSDMFSSDYLNALTAKQTAMASEEWDKAYDRYMRDRNQKLQEFSTNANLGQQAYNNKYNKNKDLLGISQNAQDNLMNAYGSNISNLANQNNTDAQNYANWQQQVAANENSRKGLFGRVFG
jgi:hypothetical protein